MPSYEASLKKATALKKAGDLPGAVRLIDEALQCSEPGTGSRPAAWKKRINYLLLDRRVDEAMLSVEHLIREAEAEARGDSALVGTAHSFAYRERARVLVAKGDPQTAFMDFLRASWHWQEAMVEQGRDASEFPPEVVADTLFEAAETCGYKIDHEALVVLVRTHISARDAEYFVSHG